MICLYVKIPEKFLQLILEDTIIITINLLIANVSHRQWLVVFSWSLSDGKYPHVSGTVLISILAYLNHEVGWMVSILPPISIYSSLFSKSLGTAPSAPITIGIHVTFIFYNFFQVFGNIKVFIHFFTFFTFYCVVCQNDKILCMASSFFFLLLIEIWFGFLAKIWWSICFSKSQRILQGFFFLDGFYFVYITMILWVIFTFWGFCCCLLPPMVSPLFTNF